MREMSGGCLCGQVKYSANADPAFVGVCHCKNCQRTSGTAFSVVVAVPKAALSGTGRLQAYRDKGDSGQELMRSFCPDCGSSLFSDAAAMPALTMIKAGTLDDTSWLDPKMHVYCSSAQRWTPIPEGSQTFAKMPG